MARPDFLYELSMLKNARMSPFANSNGAHKTRTKSVAGFELLICGNLMRLVWGFVPKPSTPFNSDKTVPRFKDVEVVDE